MAKQGMAKQVVQRHRGLGRLGRSLGLAIGALLWSAGVAWGAESVEFIYGKIRARIQVDSLTALVEENRIERDLRLYARLLEPNEIAEIRSILGEPANINNQVVFSFLNSPRAIRFCITWPKSFVILISNRMWRPCGRPWLMRLRMRGD